MEDYKVVPENNRLYPMGITKTDRGLHFCMAAEGTDIKLLLFCGDNKNPVAGFTFSEEGRMGNVWNLTLEGKDFSGLEYCYQVDGKLVPDPYGHSFSGRDHWGDLEQVNSPMLTPAEQEEFEWEGDRPLFTPFEETVIYRIHTRGLTKHPSSQVRNKGTFRGICEKIPYIKDLGITAIEMLPPVEFDEVIMHGGENGNPYGQMEPTGKINYWGYGPSHYFAPKASYSSGKHKQPVSELKELVKSLHRSGIELIIELYFNGMENPIFVLDTVRFWVREFHVDGIHLVGKVPVYLIGTDPYLSRTKLLATSWEGVPGGKRKHLGEYNDGFMADMRRLLKGDEDQINNLIYRTKRNTADYGMINYIANTNGFTMMDMVSYDMKHNEANGEGNRDGNSYNYSWNCGIEGATRKKKIVQLRKKQIRNAALLVFLSQGTPLLMSGDEFGNSKNGNNNTYCQDNEISWLNWNLLKSNKDIYEFTKFMIEFRKCHPVFHMKVQPRNMDYLSCGYPDVSYHGVKAWRPEFDNFRRQLGIMYCGEYGRKQDGTRDDYFFISYNMHWEPHEFALPNLPKTMKWHVAVNTDANEINGIYHQGEELLLDNQKQFMVPSRTIVVFIGK